MAFGEAVHAVVHNDRGDIQVPGRLRGNVLAADAEEVAVAGHHHHVQLRPGHFDAHGYGKGAPVDAVEAIGLLPLQQVNQVAAATDAGHDHIVFNGLTGFFQPVNHRELKGAAHPEISATGTPLEIVFRVLLAHTRATSFLAGDAMSLIRDTRSLTLKGKPVYWVMA